MITITKSTSSDYKTIQEIVYQTWPQTYGAILSKKQLNFMLQVLYSVSALNVNVLSKGHYFLLAKEDNLILGFGSYEHN
jgi:hypothetical protein